MSTPTLQAAIRDLVTANRILGEEGVVDAFGHISVRHPDRADRYLLARSRSPSNVEEDDIMEYDLDSNPIDQRGRIIYAERFIHGALFKERPDVMSVCHSHAHTVIPFTVTGTPIRPLWVLAGGLGPEVPIWDIRDDFPNDDEIMVTDNKSGLSLAKALGRGSACMMRGHGAAIATKDLKFTVIASIALMLNAKMQLEASVLTMASGRPIKYLSDGEAKKLVDTMMMPRGLHRAWEYWAARAGRTTDVNIVK
jgi:ribulose-5-phosphate 4-epimerase/fuculose-1-phosphate aldolase